VQSTVELLCGLFMRALALLLGSCVVGSMVACPATGQRQHGRYEDVTRLRFRSLHKLPG